MCEAQHKRSEIERERPIEGERGVRFVLYQAVCVVEIQGVLCRVSCVRCAHICIYTIKAIEKESCVRQPPQNNVIDMLDISKHNQHDII